MENTSPVNIAPVGCLKGKPLCPYPTFIFPIPNADPRNPCRGVSVTCTFAEKEHLSLITSEKLQQDANYLDLNQKLSGGKATVSYNGNTKQCVATFTDLKIHVSGFSVLEKGRWKKKTKKDFVRRFLVVIGRSDVSDTVLFEEVLPIDVYTHSAQLSSGQVYVNSVSPTVGKSQFQNEIAITGGGFCAPSFVFFLHENDTQEDYNAAIITEQDTACIRCVTPELPNGRSNIIVYSGGMPSNRDFVYQFSHKPQLNKNEKRVDITAENRIAALPEDCPSIPPDSYDWVYPSFVEKALEMFCNPEMPDNFPFGQLKRHVAAGFGKVSYLEYYLRSILEDDDIDDDTKDLRKGEFLEAEDELGATPLFISAWFDRLNCFEYLLEQGAKIDTENFDGNTCIHAAARNGSVNIMQMAIEHNIDVNALNKSKESALFYAAASGSLPAVSLLLSRKAKINIQNDAGETPLHWACYENHEEIIACLLKAGADPKIQDKEGVSPVDLGVDASSFESEAAKARKPERRDSGSKLTPTKIVPGRAINTSATKAAAAVTTSVNSSSLSNSNNQDKQKAKQTATTNSSHPPTNGGSNGVKIDNSGGGSSSSTSRTSKGTSSTAAKGKFMKNIKNKKKTLFKKKKKGTGTGNDYEDFTVSAPFEVRHGVHVDFNSTTGFSGLPSEWEALLASSGIDKEEVVKKQSSSIRCIRFC
jgi:ankyrin repeat protein